MKILEACLVYRHGTYCVAGWNECYSSQDHTG